MKFKDIRSIETVLKEYGMKPGKNLPTPVSQLGSQNKNTVSPTTSKNTVSPTITGKQPDQKTATVKLKDLDNNFEITDTQGKSVATVVSKLGNKPHPDKVVIKDPKGEYQVLDPDTDVVIPEGKLGDIVKRNKKLNKLIRKKKLREQGKELVFEINFNKKEIATQALDLPIKCGFEAETSWDGVYDSDRDEDSDWLYEYNWYDIEDFVRDQDGSNAVSRLEESYNEWILDKAMEDYESDVVAELVRDREEDEYYLNKYIEDEVDESDIEEYKERILDDLPEEDQEEYEDWDFMNWGRQFVEEELLELYREWLEEDIRDNGEAMDQAIDNARDDYDMDRWADYEYGSWQNCLFEHEIYLSNPDHGSGDGVHTVGEFVEEWASENSTSTDVKSGEYHSYSGADQTFWRVESDSSIQTDGTGAEIISPVYSTPRKMLEEMRSLFSWLEEQQADTNSSTGLHVTMSYAGTQGEGPGFKGFTNDLKINPVKLAVLLGDKYLLSTFGRENNSYAKSQYKNLEKLGNKLKSNPDAKTIEQIENILSDGISRDKFSSINFKDQKDGNTGNQLIEFRIGGGNDYHRDYPKMVKTVVRYAATLQAAYSNKLYNQDYAKALYRLIANVGKISADDEERVKDRINPDVEAPAVDVLKDYFSKDNYVEHLRYLVAAYNTLAEYQQLKNQQNEDVETDGPDADRLQDLLRKAQQQFAGAIAQAGYDYNQGHNRATPNAKSIGILRSALRDFELDYNKLSELINAHQDRIDTGERRSNLTPKVILGRIKNGVDKLFKKSVVQEPEYLSANQVEKLTQGMWNAIQSDEIKDSQEAIKFANLLAGASGQSPDSAAAWVDEVRSQSANREYKEFHAKLQRDSYGTRALFKAGEPVDSKKLKALMDYLEQYPEWDHPVAKGHNPNITGDDSYIDNALSKMMIKMRSRWEHLEDIRQDNPGLYIDSMREIALLVARLVDANKTNDDMMSNKHKDLQGTEHAYHRDGAQYFGMGLRTAEQIMDTVKGIEQPNSRMVWDEPVAHQLRDSMQNYIRSAYSRYYDMKQREGDGFYRLGSVPEIIKQRTDAIKEFLTGFDKVAQKLGFDSQSSEIANKKQLDQKQADFKKKHGPENLVKVDGYDFGGDIFIQKRVADNLSDGYTDRDLARLLTFRNKHVSEASTMLRIPSAHYFTALDAQKVLENNRYKGTWRESIAKEILEKFQNVYGVLFENLDQYYVNINEYRIKEKLKARGVEFTKDLGDGRIGMGDYGPLLDKKALEGPHGEPFSPSAATAWRVNNPELAKKVDADEKKRLNSIDIQIPKVAGVEGMEDRASEHIGYEANWSNLAKYLKIEAGVNDQGVELLKTVYDMFDSATSGEYAAEGYGMERFVDAVKKSKTYIEKNYQVSGGNYFKKNADDSIGDENTPAHLRGLNDFGRARVNFREFDYMMQNGINQYVKDSEKQELVAFLNDYSQVDTATKKAMLKLMIDNVDQHLREPMGISQALVRARPQRENMNTFDKFEKLPLAEQLRLIAKVDKNKIDEAWSKKYKDSINCSNPKGFSQKAHCAGKKKNETIEAEQDMAALLTAYGTPKKKKKKVSERPLTKDEKSNKEKYVKGMKKSKGDFEKRYGKDAKAVMYATATKMAKVKEGAVPDNSRIRILKKLLAEPMPASDIKKQMDAYFALPDPSMLRDFRELRGAQGDNVCLRPVLKNYIKMQLSNPEQNKISISESTIMEVPQEMLARLTRAGAVAGKMQAILKYTCNKPEVAPHCRNIQNRLDRVNKYIQTQQKLIQTGAEADRKAEYARGKFDGEQGFIQFNNQVDNLLTQLSTKINGKVEFLLISDDFSEAEIPTTNPHTGKPINKRDRQKAVTEKAAIDGIVNVLKKFFTDPMLDKNGKTQDKDGDGIADTKASQSKNADVRSREFVIEFLTDAANGNILKMEDVLEAGSKGKAPILSIDQIMKNVAKSKGKERYFDFYQSLVEQGIMKQTAENTTSGNVGPGELALLLLCAPAEKGKRGDLLVNGEEVEIKSGSYGGESSNAGGKFNSNFLVKGSVAGGNLQKQMIKFFDSQGLDFRKEYTTFMKENNNKIGLYAFNSKSFNMPTISTTQFTNVWNPFFESLNLSNEQVGKIAEIFALCTFDLNQESLPAHIAEVKKQFKAAFPTSRNPYAAMLKRCYGNGQINGNELAKLIMALQFTSYQYSNEGNTKLHDKILYMNKANKAVTTVSNVADLINKLNAGHIVAVKDINLTDKQQTAAHSITAGNLV